ncbi:MAG TPA: acyl-CoA desaturase [Anaeromyxobacteraceae bacterium]|nr:acyl-CoA desaturase [Anaeromyxobacteraceae bacterium]
MRAISKTSARTSRILAREEADAFGRELDGLREEVTASLGQRDVDHIRRVIRAVRYAEASGRLLLHAGWEPLSFAVGTGALAVSKILENMEVGHNVMHGQYDWTGDPQLDSRSYEWDIVCTGNDWRHYHNYEHHTFTNIVGKDRDVGYGLLRVAAEQPWNPVYLPQPLSALVLALVFQWGVGAHNLHIPDVVTGKQPLSALRARAGPFLAKAAWQIAKDYALFPALAAWNGPRVLLGNLFANTTRNVWAFAIIFCGHFPAATRFYREEETRDESRGQWYVRQVNGSANIRGGRLFHVLSGHLGFQIEHHLFPDLPAVRYPELAPRVRGICERYGQAYNTGSFTRQLGGVIGRILRHALPSGASPQVEAGRSTEAGTGT